MTKDFNNSQLSQHQKGHETILLVEDDPAMLLLVKKLLEHFGYRILIAHNGADGLALFRNAPEDIHLILSDVSMPEKNGIEMSQDIYALNPDIPIIFMSGYAADFMEQIQNSFLNSDYISKPIKVSLLLTKIRKALTASLPLLSISDMHQMRSVEEAEMELDSK